jgi:hypothetical protein
MNAKMYYNDIYIYILSFYINTHLKQITNLPHHPCQYVGLKIHKAMWITLFLKKIKNKIRNQNGVF